MPTLNVTDNFYTGDTPSLLWEMTICQSLADPSNAYGSALVEPRLFVTDPDRREELARLCLDKIGLRPAGESATVARDRMTTLSSVERERVLTETREAQKRIQKIQEAMKRKKAQEAAPAWGRE